MESEISEVKKAAEGGRERANSRMTGSRAFTPTCKVTTAAAAAAEGHSAA